MTGPPHARAEPPPIHRSTYCVEGSFGSLDHEVMIATLAANIHDNRFLRLIRNMLTAGYLEDWTYNATLSGAPQGGLCAAAHKPPYEQCWVMRSAGLLSVVTATLGVEHCA